MTTFQWLIGLITIFITPWLLWPASVFLLWLLFAIRIGRTHHITESDLLAADAKWIK